MITGNKGEWSEIYTLFKLLGDGLVHAGDADLNKLNLYYPILNIIREESKHYEYLPDSDKMVVVITENKEVLDVISMNRFVEESEALLNELKAPQATTFGVERAEAFMKEIGCSKLKAPSADKADIQIVIHDLRTNMKPQLGFSIKSQLGHPSTLLNAGTPTAVRYKVEGLTDPRIADELNSIDGHIEKLENVYAGGYKLVFADIPHPKFKNNLIFIDGCLPQLIAEILLEDSTRGSSSDVKALTEKVAERNPFGYSGSNVLAFYEHKVKQLLISSALGMTPAKEWDGRYDANGGYLVVRKDGEIVCYHFYNMNDVEDYLYANTRLERASRSRYNYGKIYEQNGSFYFDLNLQIRFKK